MKKIFPLFCFVVCSNFTFAQTVTLLTSGSKASLRGLSVLSEKIVWVSGSAGAVGKTSNGGESWMWMEVKGFEKRDFRDIEAFNDSTAIIMAVDEPAVILKTFNSGKTWKIVYNNADKGMFLDAMDFKDDKNGVVIGDPINGKFFIARTNDAGNNWKEDLITARPPADSGEACFASSGTNIRLLKNSKSVFVSGGLKAHFFTKNKKIPLPILQGYESAGANSIACKNNNTMVIVGGDFNKKDSTFKNCFITTDAGKNWTKPATQPTGYRSCIEYLKNKTWLTCGLNGVDISYNEAQDFKKISSESFNVCKKTKDGKFAYLAGAKGKIGKFIL